MKRQIEFVELLSNVQQYISSRYSAALTNDQSQLSSYIEKYIRDNDYEVEGITREKLIQKLYSEMAEYSILTPFLGKDNIEEININAWDDTLRDCIKFYIDDCIYMKGLSDKSIKAYILSAVG